MIYMPPYHIIEKYLKPNGLSEDLIDEIPSSRYFGPGLTNPMFPKPVVEQFVEERRPKSFHKESYGEEEGIKVVATGQLLNTKQAAQYLNIGVRQLQYEVGRENIGCVRLGKNCIRFAQKDLDDYVSRHRRAARGGERI
jgi:hypothetical protein